MSGVRLRDFNNSWYRPGRPLWQQMAWFFFGNPVLRCSFIPSSAFRVWLLRLFGATIGARAVIKPGVRVKYPWHLRMGQDCWLGEDCWIDNLAIVTLGSDVCVSQGAYFCTGNHDWSDPAFGLRVNGITVRDGAWVGARSTLTPGVELAVGAIAAAGSVVTGPIGPWEVHAGNPAVFVKERRLRTNDDQPPSERAAGEGMAMRAAGVGQ